MPRDRAFIGILWGRANEATPLAAETNQPDQWAGRILASAGPLLAAAARPTVTIDAPMDSDVEALQEGLERIRPNGTSHHIELTRDDWEHITENGRLCDEHEHMDLDGFQVMIRRQLCIFSLRRAAFALGVVLAWMRPHGRRFDLGELS